MSIFAPESFARVASETRLATRFAFSRATDFF